jgi:hypothetical protein
MEEANDTALAELRSVESELKLKMKAVEDALKGGTAHARAAKGVARVRTLGDHGECSGCADARRVYRLVLSPQAQGL